MAKSEGLCPNAEAAADSMCTADRSLSLVRSRAAVSSGVMIFLARQDLLGADGVLLLSESLASVLLSDEVISCTVSFRINNNHARLTSLQFSLSPRKPSHQ